MESSTREAIRAVVRGLHQSGVISSEDQIHAVMRELQAATEKFRSMNRHGDVEQMMLLSSDIGKDARIGD